VRARIAKREILLRIVGIDEDWLVGVVFGVIEDVTDQILVARLDLGG